MSAISARSIRPPFSTITRPRLVPISSAAYRPPRVSVGSPAAGRADGVVVRGARRGADRELDGLLRAAVRLADDHVLRDIDEAPGEVAGVGRTQGGVSEALAGAVGR